MTAYGALTALGIALGYVVCRRHIDATGLGQGHAALFVVLLLASGFLLAKLAESLLPGAPSLSGEVVRGVGGWSGLAIPITLGLGVVIAPLARLPAGATMDAAALGVALAIPIGRLGCYQAGCCGGVSVESGLVSSLVVPLSRGDVVTHPVQLYNAVLFAALFVALLVLARHRPAPGRLLGTFLLGFGLLRFGLGAFRSDFDAVFLGLSLDQWVGLLTAVGAAMGLTVMRRMRSSLPRPQPVTAQAR